MEETTKKNVVRIIPALIILGTVLLGIFIPATTFGYSPVEVSGTGEQVRQYTETEYRGVEDLRQMQYSFRSVAGKVLPAVVELKVVEIIKQQIPQQGWPWGFIYPYQNEGKGQEREFKSSGLGSGVIVRRDGNTYYILTNAHVAGEADEIMVVLNDETEYPATLVGKDERRDLALVKFTSRESIPVAEMGDSDQLYVGDWVLAVGSPFGFVSSVTAGIVSATGRQGPENNISEFIQTDAAINKGNSGGALVNLDGEVIGINTWIAAPTGGNVGLGFAIPINDAKQAIDDFIQKGRVDYGWLGATVTNVSESIAEEMDLGTTRGAFIHDVYLGSPAEKGGILPGDFITEIDGTPVNDGNDLVRIIGSKRAGDKSVFTLIRNGDSMTTTLRIGERDDQEKILSRQDKLWPGMIVASLNEDIKEELQLPQSSSGIIIVNLEQNSKPYIGGLRQYDIITEINGRRINGLKDFYQAVNDQSQRKLEIVFTRQGSRYSIGIHR